MTNSQQAFDEWIERRFGPLKPNVEGFPSNGIAELLLECWQACDSRWQAKLDELELIDLMKPFYTYDKQSGSRFFNTEEAAKAIIEYMRSE